MKMHQQDRYYMGGFDADLESASLITEYEKYQTAWRRASNVGGLPMATCLALAVKYPKMKQEEIEKTPSKALAEKQLKKTHAGAS